MKKIYLWLLLLIGFQAVAKTSCTTVSFTVTTIADLNAKLDYMELNSSTESVIITIADGTYNSSVTNPLNRDIDVNINGGCPCAIIGKIEKVILKGDVSWRFNDSQNVTIDGILFRNTINGGPINSITGRRENSVVYFSHDSMNNTVKNCIFMELTGTAPSDDNFFLRMRGGTNNSVEDCTFQNKSSDGNYVDLFRADELQISGTTFREFDNNTFTSTNKRYISAVECTNIVIDSSILQNKYSRIHYISLKDGADNTISNTIFNETDSLNLVTTGAKDYIKIINDTLPSILNNNFIRKFSDNNCINFAPVKISGEFPENLGGLVNNNTFGPKYQRVESSVIKIGNCDPGTASDVATTGVTVSNNTFNEYNYNYLDYYEIISNKSSGNTYEGNTFKNCVGNLRLRCGNDVIVRNNKFIRDTNAPTLPVTTPPSVSFFAGIGVSGTGHRIYNNHFDNLTYPVLEVFGGYTGNYVTVDKLEFAFNTIVNCSINVRFNAAPNTYEDMTVNSKIENNIFYNSNNAINQMLVFMDTDYDHTDTEATNDFASNSFRNNVFFKNTGQELDDYFIDSDWTLPNASTIITVNPNLSYSVTNEIYELTVHSPSTILNGAHNSTYYDDYITDDILGTTRGTNFDIGCHEYDFANRAANTDTAFIQNPSNTQLTTYPNPVKDILTVEGVTKNASYTIYNITGVQVQTGNALENQTIDVSRLSKGMYLLEIEGANTIKLIKN